MRAACVISRADATGRRPSDPIPGQKSRAICGGHLEGGGDRVQVKTGSEEVNTPLIRRALLRGTNPGVYAPPRARRSFRIAGVSTQRKPMCDIPVTERRLATARRVAARLGVRLDD